MPKAISYARTHTAIFCPGIPQLGPDLSETHPSITKSVKMTLNGDVLECAIGGKTILIPLTNIVNLVVKEVPVAKDNKASS